MRAPEIRPWVAMNVFRQWGIAVVSVHRGLSECSVG